MENPLTIEVREDVEFAFYLCALKDVALITSLQQNAFEFDERGEHLM